MAHLLNSSRDIAFAGATPWHGLGSQLTPDHSIDQWRVAAGLDWAAEKRQAYFSTRCPETGRNLPTAIPDRFALVRDDTQASLGIVSDKYKVVQPAEVMEFYRDLTADQGFQMETAGCLAGGKRIWALAKTPMTMRVMGTDTLENYLLLATSFDGSMATIAKFTSVRVVCQNTLSMSLSGQSSNTISIGHNANFVSESVKRKLGLAQTSWEELEHGICKLAETKVTPEMGFEFFKELFGEEKAFTQKKGRTSMQGTAKKVYELVRRSPGSELRSAKGTLWGFVNGVTNYYDHKAKTIGKDSVTKQSNRLNSAWFGNGETMKTKAFNIAKELAGIAA